MIELVSLPNSWALTAIDEVCDFHAGFGFPTEMQGVADQALPFYKVKDVSIAWLAHSSFLLKTEHSLSHEDADRIKAKPVPEGAVVFAKIGEALRLNRRAIVPRISLIDNNLMGISAPPTRLADRYLYWFAIATKFDVDARASVVPSIRKSDVGNLPFPLPPLAEQTRIVAKLEELLSDLDAGVAELKAAQKKLAQYRQSLLKAAVEGALTAEWRAQNTPAETGAQLLQRIVTERRARWEAKQLAKFAEQGKPPPREWQKKYPEPVQPDTTDLPDLPEGWVWASVDQVAEVFLGKMLDKTKHTSGKKMPYLRNVNVRWGSIETHDLSEMFFDSDEHERYGLVAGDVLVCEGGEPGRSAVCKKEHEVLKYQKALHRVRLFGLYEPELLVTFLEHVAKTGRLDKAFTGSTINHFTKESFLTLHIPIAPLAEQKAIVAGLSEAMMSISEQNSSIEIALKQSAAQRQNILRAAFSGQLVPQDPNDEPASVLLARIRAEHAARDTLKMPCRRKAKESV